jgi:CRISPR-associated endonuclease Csn1
VVEHTDKKKKRVRTIEPVFLYQKAAYERDPIAYCNNVLGLCDPVMIVPKVRIDALVEVNGSKLLVTSRSGDRIILKHTYQLTVGAEMEQYIKAISKYNERCAARKEELPVTKFDEISKAKNLELYHFLAEKCDTKAYQSCFSVFSIIGKELREYESNFIEMSMWEQIKILLEALKTFRCNAVYGNFELLSGIKMRGRVEMNKKISALSSAYLINQSVTGLYEHRIDLLK